MGDGEPKYEYYQVEVQRQVDDTWATIHIERSAYGVNALETADRVLRYRWPVDIYAKEHDPIGHRLQSLAGAAATHRLVVTPAGHNRRGDTATATVGEILLHRVAGCAASRRAASDALAKARAAYKEAKSRARGAEYDLKWAVAEATNAGVATADISRARRRRTPRREGSR